MTGDLFVYLDTLLTIEEGELKTDKQVFEILDLVNQYYDMYLKWLSVAPLYFDWAGPMFANKNLHLVSPEAAILRLGLNFIQIITLILNGQKTNRTKGFY